MVTLDLAIRRIEFLDLPYNTLPSSLSLRSLSPFLFNRLRLLAAAVVPGGTWRVATPSSRRRRRLSCRLSWRPGRTRRPDLLLLRANFGRRPSSLNGGDLIFFWRPCIPNINYRLINSLYLPVFLYLGNAALLFPEVINNLTEKTDGVLCFNLRRLFLSNLEFQEKVWIWWRVPNRCV